MHINLAEKYYKQVKELSLFEVLAVQMSWNGQNSVKQCCHVHIVAQFHFPLYVRIPQFVRSEVCPCRCDCTFIQPTKQVEFGNYELGKISMDDKMFHTGSKCFKTFYSTLYSVFSITRFQRL